MTQVGPEGRDTFLKKPFPKNNQIRSKNGCLNQLRHLIKYHFNDKAYRKSPASQNETEKKYKDIK